MAITKIHPIYKTLNTAIDYIVNEEKTDKNIYVSSFNCHKNTADIQFINTRKTHNVNGTVLARHLIQSFYPGEVTPEKAHKIGIDLCKKILGNDYEYIISTHVDREHIHNHILFNNVSFKTGKCYQSNKKSYHRIRAVSDELCKENGLIVIDEYYEKYKKKFKTKGKSYYEYQVSKNGKSWKSKLQFAVDNTIEKASNWDEFLSIMQSCDYEIKYGKHIAFRHKDQERFTRLKTIGEDYTEKRIRERIEEPKQKIRRSKLKHRVNNIIDIENNEKIKSSKGYEFWARKHNVQALASTLKEMRDEGINSSEKLEEKIKSTARERQNLLDNIKKIENRQSLLDDSIEDVNTVRKYRQIYLYSKKNPSDRKFESEYSRELMLYNSAEKRLRENFKRMPDSKALYLERCKIEKEKEPLMQELEKINIKNKDLFTIRKNIEKYIGKDIER